MTKLDCGGDGLVEEERLIPQGLADDVGEGDHHGGVGVAVVGAVEEDVVVLGEGDAEQPAIEGIRAAGRDGREVAAAEVEVDSGETEGLVFGFKNGPNLLLGWRPFRVPAGIRSGRAGS